LPPLPATLSFANKAGVAFLVTPSFSFGVVAVHRVDGDTEKSKRIAGTRNAARARKRKKALLKELFVPQGCHWVDS